MLLKAFLISMNILFSNEQMHKHYVSIAELEFNKKEKQVEASIQLTGHDLEYALQKISSSEIRLKSVETNEKDSTLILTEAYLKNRFKLIISDKEYFPKVIGIENNNDGNAYIYTIFEKVKKIKNVEVKNSILMDHFEAQQNILHFKNGVSKKTRTFTSNQKLQQIEFK